MPVILTTSKSTAISVLQEAGAIRECIGCNSGAQRDQRAEVESARAAKEQQARRDAPACTGAYLLSTLLSVAKLLAGASSGLLRASACNRVITHVEKLHSRRCLLLSSSRNFLNFQTIRVAR